MPRVTRRLIFLGARFATKFSLRFSRPRFRSPALALTWLAAKLGPDIARALHAAHIDQVMTRAIEAGFALVEGAEKGKVLEIPVANAVLRRAAQYLAVQAPGLFKELGDNLGQMLVARLSASGALPPQASADNLDLAPAAHMKTERAAA